MQAQAVPLGSQPLGVERSKSPTLSIVLPVFNEEAVLPALRERLDSALGELGLRWEVVFVDDGSRDRTPAMLRAIHASDGRYRVVSLSRNFGHQAAVTAGLTFAGGDVVAVLDADLQDPPELLAEFLESWRAGYDVVYGVRTHRKEGFIKKLCYRIFYRVLRSLADIEIPLDSGDFCLMDRRVVQTLNALPERARFVRGLRAWVGFPQIGLAYERQGRSAGETKYPLSKLMRLAMDGIVSFSTRPLSIMSLVGGLTAVFSFLGMVFFLLHRIIGFKVFGYSPQDVPGFTSVILAVLMSGGLQLLGLGLIGEYLGLVFAEVKQRPPFVVKEQLGESVARTDGPD